MRRAVEQELIHPDKTWNDAEVRSDIATLRHILADAFRSIDEHGAIVTRAAILETFTSGNLVVESITCDD